MNLLKAGAQVDLKGDLVLRLTVFKCLFFFSVLREPLFLSDSRLHLFLQSDLSIMRMERCALGKTMYTVAEAIQRSSSGFISRLEDKGCDSDSERYEFGLTGLHYIKV